MSERQGKGQERIEREREREDRDEEGKDHSSGEVQLSKNA